MRNNNNKSATMYKKINNIKIQEKRDDVQKMQKKNKANKE